MKENKIYIVSELDYYGNVVNTKTFDYEPEYIEYVEFARANDVDYRVQIKEV